jgi:hypothetical protein
MKTSHKLIWLLIVVLLGLLIDVANAQEVIPLPPVVLEEPEPDYLAWFADDVASEGLIEAVKMALGRDSESWIEGWLVMEMGIDRPDAHRVVYRLYGKLFGRQNVPAARNRV